MRTTIDKAGRVVIPTAMRERAGLAPGSEVELTEDGVSIRLERPVIDIAALVERERGVGLQAV